MPEPDAPRRLDDPALLPFAPLIHSAWSDGLLTASELRALRAHADAQTWLPQTARAMLDRWLDPDAPPSPRELAELRDRIRSVPIADEPEATASLADLGLALSRAEGGPTEGWSDPGAVASLHALEAALGLVGREAVRRLLDIEHDTGGGPARAPWFDAAALRAYLDADHLELRDRVLGLMGRPPLRIPSQIPLDEYRERVLDAVRLLADHGYGSLGYPAEWGGGGDPTAPIAVFETLAYGDLSVVVKFGVQFGLFGGSVLQLGTEHHHRTYLERIARLELPGCYAMTETGHGSNVRDLETTATYDPETDELVIHTPRERAGKDWIGNAARHGRIATVFARLVVADTDHGVHAVLVPLRDEAGKTLPGVRIEDRGPKEGLNGVDNGRIWFDRVRTPRTNLLDRFGSIDARGRYSSPIPSPSRRFFTMLGTLVMGRISIAAASVSAAKTGLTIAVRRTSHRRQFGPEGGGEVPLLDYPLVQRALLPRLATTLGLHFAVRALARLHATRTPADNAEVEVLAAGLKAYASRHCVETLQACREACGGEGYDARNRFAELKADTDVFTTFEGANLVLLQMVAKGLLSRFRHQMGDLALWTMVRYLAERAGTTLAELNPVVTRRTDEEHLCDPAFHHAAFTYREERLLRSAARRLKSRIDDGMDSHRAVSECQDHLVQLARAHVERVVLDHFRDGILHAPTPGLSEALGVQASLYALSRMEASRAWYLECGYIEPSKARAIRRQVNLLCAESRTCARLLVDAFGIPDEVLGAPIAT